MKVLRILIVMLILIMSVGAVCAAEGISDDAICDDSNEILETVQEDITTDDSSDILKTAQNDIYTANDDSFTNLTDEIKDKDGVDLTHDYKFNNQTDDSNGILISRDNFVLNGNGRTIDANNQSRIFNITANNVTLSNLILNNGNAKEGGAIYATGTLTLNNVTFTNNYATEKGGAVALYENVTLNCDDIRFIDNYGGAGSSIYVDKGNLNLYNSYITSNIFSKRGQIVFKKSKIIVDNVTFINIVASYTPALYVEEGKEAYITNSKFINLMANISAGALAVKGVGYTYIKDCEFVNTTSYKNAGAVLADVAGDRGLSGSVEVLDTIFKDTYSGFGGAYLQLGEKLLLNNTEFTNCHGKYNGGAVYLSYTESEINNCTFTSNGVEKIEGYPTYGGAIFSDISTLIIDQSKFINNTASAANAIYAYDTSYTIKNSRFENNTNPIYTFFDKESFIDDETNIFINDNNISTNNELHASIIIGQGVQLTLLNNTINVTNIPASFDLRNYSWVTPVKDQGWMGACWTFGMTSALESALLKATGINADFSENNMQNTMLRYSIYGQPMLCEGGTNTLSSSYFISWLGAFPQEADDYDELGKISPLITTNQNVHVQDVIFIPNNEIPNGTQIKLAIMKYGALDVCYFGQSTYNEKNPYYDPNTYAQYVNVTTNSNHEVSVVGWDDNFPKEKFLIHPPGDGAWIIKNSWDTDWGDNGYLYVSYYDKSFSQSTKLLDYTTAIIIENTEPYNKNYQYDLLWGGSFLPNTGCNISYYNQFEALDDDLIAAVGTYFNRSDAYYKVEIYVNDKLKLTQEGVSPYLGYHTIKLNDYIPIRKGDVFKAVVTSEVMPFINVGESRTHYTNNISFSCFDGQTWDDNFDYNVIACLKVYTVANPSLSELQEAIANSTENYLELNVDYEFRNGTDNSTGISISRDNFVLNGNGRIIDGNNLSRIFNITANNVTLSNLILKNANAEKGGAIYATGLLTLNNVTFIDNYAAKQGGAIGLYSGATLNCNNSKFLDNYAEAGSSIYADKNAKLDIYNSYIASSVFNKYSQIASFEKSIVYVENVTFTDTSSSYATALFLRGVKASIINSKFINLKANITAGAICIRNGGEIYIKNCEFINTTSSKNGGAVFADIIGEDDTTGNVTLLDSTFKNTSSEFGGAYVQLGGKLWLNNTEFTNAHAVYNGGAVYLSYIEYGEINSCNFTSNGVKQIEGYPTYGGAMVIDMTTLNISNSRFINNTASAGNAIYAYDASYGIKNSVFENNVNAIYTVFDKESSIDESTIFNNDTLSLNNTYFATIITGQGLQLELINNDISVSNIPSRFDLRDWGWVSPIRNQGWIGACWTFGMTGTLESALLKATGIKADLSENNMRNSMIRYSIYGSKDLYEGAYNVASISYLLSWLGAFTQDADTFDEVGKLSPIITTLEDIHVQDAIFLPNNEIPNGTQIKLAIMKYGSIDVSYFGQSTYNEANPYYNPEKYAQYVNISQHPNHEVSIIGWDDNFPKENFLITPPGDGAWIVKNSWGPDWGDNGCLYVSYYDKSIMPSMTITEYAAAIIFENTVPYNKNYQYDIMWVGNFQPLGETVSYMNQYEALDDDLIAAVGTYFNQSGVDYTVEIFVNGELKLTQKGVSPYLGFHTIKLDQYIPIKKGDIFKAKITSNTLPLTPINDMRVHYTSNLSFASMDGVSWGDLYDDGYVACLKVYTVADDSIIIENKDISVDYDGGKYFSVKVVTADGHAVGAGAKVTFTINKKTKTVTTDKNGIAKIKITDLPKKYTITTKYNGKTYKNTVTVKQVLTTKKVTVKKTAKKFTLQATLKINGKLVKGKVIKFKLNGKTYKAKTNKKGVAQKTLTKKVIKKLKKGKTYKVKVTYKKDTIKTTLKVKK